jgi:hypothetical protein
MSFNSLCEIKNDKQGNLCYFYESQHKDTDITFLKYFLQVPILCSVFFFAYTSWSNTGIDILDCLKFTEQEVDYLVFTQFIITWIRSFLPKSISSMFLHFALNSQRIPSTPISFYPKSIFVYRNWSPWVSSTESWRDGAFPRFQYDYVLHYFQLTYR